MGLTWPQKINVFTEGLLPFQRELRENRGQITDYDESFMGDHNASLDSVVDWYVVFNRLKKAGGAESSLFDVCRKSEGVETLDITRVSHIAASKSQLHEYRNLDEFAEKRCPDWIQDQTVQNIENRLKHGELRLFDRPLEMRDVMVERSWMNGLGWSNSGGSHNFATIRYLAKKLGVPVKIETNVIREQLVSRIARKPSPNAGGE
ncbi:MAG: hypothetical protein IE928_10470 [Gammaproteobacteria bacterium]|nr:hypothetical protein [Gammaproteobacteria bacterium]